MTVPDIQKPSEGSASDPARSEIASHLFSFTAGAFAAAAAMAAVAGAVDLVQALKVLAETDVVDVETFGAGAVLTGGGAGVIGGVTEHCRKKHRDFCPRTMAAGALTSIAAIAYGLTPATHANQERVTPSSQAAFSSHIREAADHQNLPPRSERSATVPTAP